MQQPEYAVGVDVAKDRDETVAIVCDRRTGRVVEGPAEFFRRLPFDYTTLGPDDTLPPSPADDTIPPGSSVEPTIIDLGSEHLEEADAPGACEHGIEGGCIGRPECLFYAYNGRRP